MPLMGHGGRPPTGEARSFEQAKRLFQEGFEKWSTSLPAGQLEENLITNGQQQAGGPHELVAPLQHADQA
jgi:hypothetical protein